MATIFNVNCDDDIGAQVRNGDCAGPDTEIEIIKYFTPYIMLVRYKNNLKSYSELLSHMETAMFNYYNEVDSYTDGSENEIVSLFSIERNKWVRAIILKRVTYYNGVLKFRLLTLDYGDLIESDPQFVRPAMKNIERMVDYNFFILSLDEVLSVECGFEYVLNSNVPVCPAAPRMEQWLLHQTMVLERCFKEAVTFYLINARSVGKYNCIGRMLIQNLDNTFADPALELVRHAYATENPLHFKILFNVPSLSDITHLTFVEFELNLLKILNRPSGVIQIHEIRGIMFGESTPTIKISSESDTIVEKPNERRKLIRKKILIAKRRLNKDNAFINERVETISKFVNNKLNLYEDDLSQFIKNDKLSSRKDNENDKYFIKALIDDDEVQIKQKYAHKMIVIQELHLKLFPKTIYTYGIERQFPLYLCYNDLFIDQKTNYNNKQLISDIFLCSFIKVDNNLYIMICPKVAFNISNYVYIDFNTILKESNSTTLLTDSKPKIIQNEPILGQLESKKDKKSRVKKGINKKNVVIENNVNNTNNVEPKTKEHLQKIDMSVLAGLYYGELVELTYFDNPSMFIVQPVKLKNQYGNIDKHIGRIVKNLARKKRLKLDKNIHVGKLVLYKDDCDDYYRARIKSIQLDRYYKNLYYCNFLYVDHGFDDWEYSDKFYDIPSVLSDIPYFAVPCRLPCLTDNIYGDLDTWDTKTTGAIDALVINPCKYYYAMILGEHRTSKEHVLNYEYVWNMALVKADQKLTKDTQLVISEIVEKGLAHYSKEFCTYFEEGVEFIQSLLRNKVEIDDIEVLMKIAERKREKAEMAKNTNTYISLYKYDKENFLLDEESFEKIRIAEESAYQQNKQRIAKALNLANVEDLDDVRKLHCLD